MPKRHTTKKTRQNVTNKKPSKQKAVAATRIVNVKKAGRSAAKPTQKIKPVSKVNKLSKGNTSKPLRRSGRTKAQPKAVRIARPDTITKTKAGTGKKITRKSVTGKVRQRRIAKAERIGKVKRLDKRTVKKDQTDKLKIKPKIGFVKHFGKRVKDDSVGNFRKTYVIDLSKYKSFSDKLSYIRNSSFEWLNKFKFITFKKNFHYMKDYFIQVVNKFRGKLFYSKLYFGFPPGEFDNSHIKAFTINTLVDYNNNFVDRLAEDGEDYLSESGKSFNPNKIVFIQMQFIYSKVSKLPAA